MVITRQNPVSPTQATAPPRIARGPDGLTSQEAPYITGDVRGKAGSASGKASAEPTADNGETRGDAVDRPKRLTAAKTQPKVDAVDIGRRSGAFASGHHVAASGLRLATVRIGGLDGPREGSGRKPLAHSEGKGMVS